MRSLSPIIVQHTARDFDVLIVNDHVQLSTANYYTMPIGAVAVVIITSKKSALLVQNLERERVV